uniref:Uncharacterized protein n=1 Tax=Noccaea caerulescens TaxID=107243 RepID=A0A1J3DJ78_NOCCA
MVIHEHYDATHVNNGVNSVWNDAPARMIRVEGVAADRMLYMRLHRFSLLCLCFQKVLEKIGVSKAKLTNY